MPTKNLLTSFFFLSLIAAVSTSLGYRMFREVYWNEGECQLT